MIRPYSPADLETLREMTVIAFDGTSVDQNIENLVGEIGGRDWRWRKARVVDTDAEANPEGILVYEEDGRILGYIACRIDSDSKIGWISNMAVLPSYQGRGIGKALMTACFDYLEASGMDAAKIETLEQNRVGPTFYPRVGFREVSRQIHYILPLKERKI